MTQSNINDDKDADIEDACEEFERNSFMKCQYYGKQIKCFFLKCDVKCTDETKSIN